MVEWLTLNGMQVRGIHAYDAHSRIDEVEKEVAAVVAAGHDPMAAIIMSSRSSQTMAVTRIFVLCPGHINVMTSACVGCSSPSQSTSCCTPQSHLMIADQVMFPPKVELYHRGRNRSGSLDNFDLGSALPKKVASS